MQDILKGLHPFHKEFHQINNNVYRVYIGPFNNIKSIKVEFDKINLMDFDNIDIIKL